jgi:hypothetical protein
MNTGTFMQHNMAPEYQTSREQEKSSEDVNNTGQSPNTLKIKNEFSNFISDPTSNSPRGKKNFSPMK